MPIPSSDSGRRITSARRVALDAALLTAALMLSYLEHLLPLGALDALAVSMLRVGITGVLFGSWTSLFFSLGGACMTYLALWLARVLLRRCSYLGVSVLCAAAHNTGQVLAACAIMPSPGGAPFGLLTTLLPYLLLAALPCGALTGVLLDLLIPRLERWFRT